MARVCSMLCLTAAAQFRFGDAPVVVGHEAIHAAAARFFSAMRPADTDRCARGTVSRPQSAGEVTHTRHDGSVLSVPFANVFELRGDKIAAYRIYIDNSLPFSKPL